MIETIISFPSVTILLLVLTLFFAANDGSDM